MSRKFFIVMLTALLAISMGTSLYGQPYKAAIMELPGEISDVFSKVTTAIVEATGNTVEIKIVPPARTTLMVERGEVDFSLPMLALSDPEKIKALGYDYSEAVLYNLAFVLITNKSKPISIAELKNGNPKGYKIEVDLTQVDSWEFKGIPSTDFTASVRRVAEGKIDGFLHSQSTLDTILKNAPPDIKITNLKRQLYKVVDSIFPLPKGTRGGKVDKMLQLGISKLRKSGKFEQIFPIEKTDRYNDWQP